MSRVCRDCGTDENLCPPSSNRNQCRPCQAAYKRKLRAQKEGEYSDRLDEMYRRAYANCKTFKWINFIPYHGAYKNPLFMVGP